MASNNIKILKGVSVTTLVTIIMGILEIVVFSIMSRLLSKQDFGYYAALYGIMAIVLCISEAGMGASIVQRKNATQSMISTAFTLSFIIGCLSTIIVFILSPFISSYVADSSVTGAMRIMSFSVLIACMCSIGRSLMLKKLRFKAIGVITIVSYLVSSPIAIYMAYNGMGVYAIIAQHMGNSVLLMILFFLGGGYIPRFGFNKTEAKSIFSFGGWLTLGVIANNITHQLDKLMMSRLISVEALGCYNRPAGFLNNISSRINGIFDTVLFPTLSNLQDNKDKVKNAYLKAISILNSFSIVLASVFFFNSRLITTIFLGNEWTDYAYIMQIASIGTIFVIDNRLVDCFFRSLNFVKTGFYIRVFALFYTIISIYIGAQYGIVGVVVSLVFANISIIIIKLWILMKKIDVNITEATIKIIQSFKPALVLIAIGVPFLTLSDQRIISEALFAFFFGCVIIVEFVFVPQMVSRVYTTEIYPTVVKIKNKIFKR